MESDVLSNLIIEGVHSATTVYNGAGAGGKRDFRARWAVIIKYEGESVYFSEGREYHSNINNIVVLPKGCAYSWKCIRSGHCAIVEFDSDLTHNHLIHFKINGGEKILERVKALEIKRTLKSDFLELESIKDVYSIICMLIRSEPKRYVPTEKQRKIAPVLDYIAKHYNEKMSNEELAKMTGFSTVYFRKLFTDTVGQSPIDYINYLRIQKAKNMLESDCGSITDIAVALGYKSIYDFSRSFKKHVGVSPKSYRESEE